MTDSSEASTQPKISQRTTPSPVLSQSPYTRLKETTQLIASNRSVKKYGLNMLGTSANRPPSGVPKLTLCAP